MSVTYYSAHLRALITWPKDLLGFNSYTVTT